MHRDLRHKIKPVPVRKSVRRASTTTEESSDEDSYAGVDQISDSEEDEPDVEEVEERAILASENGDTPRPSQDEAWEGFSDCPGGILEGDLPLFGQDAAVQKNWDGSVDEDAGDEESDEETPVVRRVRFEESDSEIDMAYDDVFKDIFIDKDILDPSFRRQIEPDDVSDDGSYWEHEENIDYTGPEEQDDSDDSDSSGSSGYDCMWPAWILMILLTVSQLKAKLQMKIYQKLHDLHLLDPFSVDVCRMNHLLQKKNFLALPHMVPNLDCSHGNMNPIPHSL